MVEIKVIFCDVGGVILSNGWDLPLRGRAAARFGLDWDDFEKRHEPLVAAMETGKLGLDEYLDRTIFHQPRSFSREQFKEFIFAQSRRLPETFEVIAALSHSGQYLMATLNNESFELNLFRIHRFGLRGCFAVFFSSCFLGVRKPEPAIYRMALQVTQRSPEECLFIDDRPENVAGAKQAGMHTILCRDAEQLRRDVDALLSSA